MVTVEKQVLTIITVALIGLAILVTNMLVFAFLSLTLLFNVFAVAVIVMTLAMLYSAGYLVVRLNR